MKRLILTRHAKSSWDDPLTPDHDRPLNDRGKAAAADLGQWLASRDYVPGEVLCSDALRTRKTFSGIAPALPERNLREQAYWVDPTVIAQPAFTWVLGTDVSIGPVQVPRAVDLRQDGRIAIHVWAPRAVVTVTDTPRMP